MDEIICPSCSSPLPERAIYCPSCAQQVRCKKCHDLLEPSAIACVMCGTSINEIANGATKESVRVQNLAPNSIEYRETLKSRTLKASFTDQMGSSLNETLNLLLSNRIDLRNGIRQTEFYGEGEAGSKPLITDGVTKEDQSPLIDSEFIQKQHSDDLVTDDRERLKKIFRFDDNNVELIEPRIKASNRLDFARRLTYLFLYLMELENRGKVQRSELNEILKQNSVLTHHERNWISNCPDLEVKNDFVALRTPGREKAVEILEEVFDISITKSWLPGTSSKKRNGKRISLPKDEKEHKDQKTEKTPDIQQKREKSSSPKNRVRSSSGRPSPTQILEELINKGYFSQRRMLGEIISYCSTSLAQSYKNTDLSPALNRFVKKSKLNRELNSNGQFEYFV